MSGFAELFSGRQAKLTVAIMLMNACALFASWGVNLWVPVHLSLPCCTRRSRLTVAHHNHPDHCDADWRVHAPGSAGAASPFHSHCRLESVLRNECVAASAAWGSWRNARGS